MRWGADGRSDCSRGLPQCLAITLRATGPFKEVQDLMCFKHTSAAWSIDGKEARMGARRQIGKLLQDPGEEPPAAQATVTVVVDSGCFICLFVLVALRSMRDLSSLTRDQTRAPSTGSTESQPLDLQGSPDSGCILKVGANRIC